MKSGVRSQGPGVGGQGSGVGGRGSAGKARGRTRITAFIPSPDFCLLSSLLTLCLLAVPLPASAQRGQAPQDPNILAAENHIKQHNYVKAIEALELALSREPRSSPEAYVMLATSRLNTGERDKAIEVCEQGMNVHPNSERLASFYVSLLQVAATEAETKTKLEAKVKQNSTSALYRKALGGLLLKQNPLDPRVEELLAAAAKLAPRDAEARYLYGQWACLNNREALCVAELKSALALSPTNDQAQMQIYTLIGMAEDKLHHTAQAEAAFRSAMQFNRKLERPNPHAAIQYADFLIKRLRDAEAQRIVDEVLRWSPEFGPARFERAKFLAKQGKMAEAVDECRGALEYPHSNKIQLRAMHAFMAKTLFALGRVEEAQTHQSWIESQQ